MRGVVMHSAGDVRVEDREDPKIIEPTDAVIRLDRDLHLRVRPVAVPRRRARRSQAMGHEYVGVVEQIGDDGEDGRSRATSSSARSWSPTTPVRSARPDSSPSACTPSSSRSDRHPGREARIPHADGTLVATPGSPTRSSSPRCSPRPTCSGPAGSPRSPRGRPGKTVAVVGDGAVGLMAVLAAKQLGAERIIAMSRHADRQELARYYGATDIVEERGDEGVAKIKELTGGLGAHSRGRGGRHAGVDHAGRSARPAAAGTSATSASTTTSRSPASSCSSPASTSSAAPLRCAASCPS